MEKAEGLGRAAVMEEVLGPHLDAMLRPLYEAGIDPYVSMLPSLEGEFPLRVLADFSDRLRMILMDRFQVSEISGPAYKELLDLNDERPELLFHKANPIENIREALGTSVGVPLTVAKWISGLEMPRGSSERSYRTVATLTEIMERESFRAMLLRLTKGPNEFLGKGSDSFTDNGFVNFYDLDLLVRNAFDMEDGRVVGLSGAYAVAADRRRKELRSRPTEAHHGNDSSGCPVRHGFKGSDGEPQIPLVLTGSEFAVGALRYAERLPLVLPGN
jgi:hypothetical protein